MPRKTFIEILSEIRKKDKKITADIFFRPEFGYWTARLLTHHKGGIIESGNGNTPQEAMNNCAKIWNEIYGAKQSQSNKSKPIKRERFDQEEEDIDYEDPITAFDFGADF